MYPYNKKNRLTELRFRGSKLNYHISQSFMATHFIHGHHNICNYSQNAAVSSKSFRCFAVYLICAGHNDTGCIRDVLGDHSVESDGMKAACSLLIGGTLVTKYV